MRADCRVRADVVCGLIVSALAAGGCVEAFDGSNVQIDFNQGVHTNTRPGGTPQEDQPPPNTHYELYAADVVYARDADGNVQVGGDGNPIIEQTFLFEVVRFSIRSAIDRTSPCFIDIEADRFPGVHVTEHARAVRASVGLGLTDDPTAAGLAREQIVDVLTADRRSQLLVDIEAELSAVVSHANFRYPAIDTVCSDDPASDPLAIPPPSCIDAASNARRLSLCRTAWASDPDYYEGSDKVFTLPLNGHFFGMVEGENPINGGFVGGSGFFVRSNLVGVDAYTLNWQYDDLDRDGVPDFPATIPEGERSPTGVTYLRGEPVEVTRSTITVPLRHVSNASITATMAIFPNLASDDVNF